MKSEMKLGSEVAVVAQEIDDLIEVIDDNAGFFMTRLEEVKSDNEKERIKKVVTLLQNLLSELQDNV